MYMHKRVAFLLAVVAAGTTDLRVEAAPTDGRLLVESYGNCVEVSLKRAGKSAVKMLEHVCHGWSVEDCGAQMFFRRHGIRIDYGKVAWRSGRSVDVAAKVAARLERTGDEPLHLRFLQPVCTRRGFELPFSGSWIERGEAGPASKLEGRAKVTDGDAVLVTLGR